MKDLETTPKNMLFYYVRENTDNVFEVWQVKDGESMKLRDFHNKLTADLFCLGAQLNAAEWNLWKAGV